MGSVNRATLRDQARLYANAGPGGSNAFVTDASLNTLINSCAQELYDVLIAARGHEYYATDADIAVVSGTSAYPLPTDFYQLLSVRLYWSSTEIEELHPMGVRERTRYETLQTFDRGTAKAYRLKGTQAASARTVEILPIPTQAVTANIRYIPIFAPLADDSATFDGVNGWDKLVALKVALEWKTIAEKPPGPLVSLYTETLQRIQGLADQRNANYAEQVQQVYPEGRRGFGVNGALGAGYGIFDDSFDGSFN